MASQKDDYTIPCMTHDSIQNARAFNVFLGLVHELREPGNGDAAKHFQK
jgi:hypothetical protein